MKFTPLEIAVLDALADDIVQVSDLDAQIEEARPVHRRNTGDGFVTDIVVDRSRPPVTSGGRLTGAFGTIHADVEGLVDPMAFQLILREGRIMSLRGQTYDEDTRAIDFTTARFWGLFFIGPTGESLPVRPRKLGPTVLQRTTDEIPSPLDPFPASPPQEPTTLTNSPASEDDVTSLMIALAVGAVILAIVLLLVVKLPFVFVIGIGAVALNALRNRSVRDLLKRLLAAAKAQESRRLP